jgi:SAM-dependent methyltransferase
LTVIRSYSSLPSGARTRLREFVELYRAQSSGVPEKVRDMIARLEHIERLVYRHTGVAFRDLRLLEIGCGQRLNQTTYFAQRNEVVGIDLDVIAQGFDLTAYFTMLRENGPIRFAKTIGRKALGLDRRCGAELRRQLGPGPRHTPSVLRMDASRMTFRDGSFDGAVSFSVFEHLADPTAVIGETARVLRPGGVACLALHLYTAENGAHDPRIISGNRADLPMWAHLRPKYRHLVTPNSFLNEIRLGDWRELFATGMPGVRFEYLQHRRDALLPELEKIRRLGELADYSDEELLTVELIAIWRKPEARN